MRQYGGAYRVLDVCITSNWRGGKKSTMSTESSLVRSNVCVFFENMYSSMIQRYYVYVFDDLRHDVYGMYELRHDVYVIVSYSTTIYIYTSNSNYMSQFCITYNYTTIQFSLNIHVQCVRLTFAIVPYSSISTCTTVCVAGCIRHTRSS